MSNFLQDLNIILYDDGNIQKNLNIELNNPFLTKAIDAMLPDPNVKPNQIFHIDNIVLFDIEFYTLVNPEISQFGFTSNDEFNKTANLAREVTLFILERVYTDDDHYWIIRSIAFFNINNEFLFKSLYFIRRNYAILSENGNKDSPIIRGPYLRMLSRYFMMVNDQEYDSELEIKLKNNQIKNRDGFINRLREIVSDNINSDNYLGYSDHRYYYPDKDMMKFHDSVMSAYINNSHVKKRELSAVQTLNVFKLLKSYEKKYVLYTKEILISKQ